MTPCNKFISRRNGVIDSILNILHLPNLQLLRCYQFVCFFFLISKQKLSLLKLQQTAIIVSDPVNKRRFKEKNGEGEPCV